MKLTNETVQPMQEQGWKDGDYFVRRGKLASDGGLRRLVKVDGLYIVVSIDTYQTMQYPGAGSADGAMTSYIRINGEVAKVVINEIIFEEVTK